MKIWKGFGSEHSNNLVMVGTFKDVASAREAKIAIDELTNLVSIDGDDHQEAVRYSEKALALLEKLHFHSVGPAELEQFRYDIQSSAKGERIVVTTDEIEISAFMKLFINRGARVEVYSAHDFPNLSQRDVPPN